MLNWKAIFKGMAMGTVETVPGVSSSTIAVLMGIYERLIEAIGQLTSKRWKEGIAYLIPLGIGMFGGFIISVMVIKYLLEHYFQPTHFLFMGLVFGILPSLWRTARTESKEPMRLRHYVLILLSLLAVAATRFLDVERDIIMTDLTASDYLFLFVSGWLASTALILPGISGALILTLLGVYYTAISAISSMNLPVIFTIGAGIVAGILITSRLIRFLLQRYALLMYASMLGLVAGSIVVLYPGYPVGALNSLICVIALAAGYWIALIAGRVKRGRGLPVVIEQ